MNRRQMLIGAAAAGGVGASQRETVRRKWTGTVQRLNLRHTWTTVMSSSQFRETLYLRFEQDGITGRGEGAGIARYGETAQRGLDLLNANGGWMAERDPWQYVRVMQDVFTKIEGNYAFKAAVDIALLDWVSQRAGVPLWKFFGLDRNDAAKTTFSIGIDKAEVIRRKVKEAEPYPILKIKVGLDNDEEVIAAVRGVTKKPLRVDANEGFKTKEQAVEKINWLESQGAISIEQPMKAGNLEDMNWIRKRVHIPVIADEACLHASDIPRLAPHFDGVNVKVDKCGGLLEARRMIEMARALKMETMIGCMISSSVAITAAAQLAPLVDHADLDGNLLIGNDPYEGVSLLDGKMVLSERPGLGLAERKG
ncbi:MAG: dipeptide epimerase [Candidatus Solibacter sp.]|nr:dipeptide epimerase [Candidatus Solibacter sp.]